MIFVLDHDVPEAIARVAAQAGHIVEHIREVMSSGATDAEILAFANAKEAVLITCNRNHFLALSKRHPHAGIIILIRRASRVAESSHFLRLLKSAGESGLAHNINFA